MRMLRVFVLLLVVTVIGGCGIYHVDQPSDAKMGDTVTINMEILGDGETGDEYIPVVCINLPTGWTVGGMTFTGIINSIDETSLTGEAGTVDTASETYMQTNYANSGYVWSCYDAPQDVYSSDAYGSASFDVTLAADADGTYTLSYSYGDSLAGNPDDGGMVARTMLVNTRADILDIWISGVPLTNYWTSGAIGSKTAYGNGRYIATGSDLLGTTMSVWNSTDGISWGEHIPVDGNGFPFAGSVNVIYAEGLFVAVGDAGSIETSVDGITWTAQAAVPDVDDYLRGLAHGADTFVSVGSVGNIVSSDDGKAWTKRTSGTTNTLMDVTYGSAGFVAVGDVGEILNSPDGVIWTPQTSGTTVDLEGVAFGNDIYVAVGKSGTILKSPDGKVWATVASGIAGDIRGIGFGDGVFALVTYSSIYTSTDGSAWTQRETGSTLEIFNISFANGRFVAMADLDLLLTARASNAAPSAPALVAPEAEAMDLDSSLITFIWNTSTDADGDTVTYNLYACESSDFVGCDPLNATEITASTKAAATYAAMGGTGVLCLMGFAFAGGLSRRRKIALVIVGLLVGTMMLVGCGSSSSSSSNSAPTKISYDVTSLTAGTAYFWKVVATDQYGAATTSEIREFTTAP